MENIVYDANDLGGYISITDCNSLSIQDDVVAYTSIMSIDDLIKEKLDEYREIMRLQALGCRNCGGSINRDTLICEYCGTNYRN